MKKNAIQFRKGFSLADFMNLNVVNGFRSSETKRWPEYLLCQAVSSTKADANPSEAGQKRLTEHYLGPMLAK